jgi:hypothetical protein
MEALMIIDDLLPKDRGDSQTKEFFLATLLKKVLPRQQKKIVPLSAAK